MPAIVSQSRSTVVGPDNISTIARPAAPDTLTDEQAGVWSRIVNAIRADWFGPETHGDLANYCRHEVQSNRIAQLITAAEEADEFDVDEYDKLLKMQERETRAMASLAVRLRIAPSATVTKDKTKGSGKGPRRPWQE